MELDMLARGLIGLAFIALMASFALAQTTATEREWRKSNGKYTIEEFRRDRQACMNNSVVDEECMSRRGWIVENVSPRAGSADDPQRTDRRPRKE